MKIEDIKTVEEEFQYHVDNKTGTWVIHMGKKSFAIIKDRIQTYMKIDSQIREMWKKRAKKQYAKKMEIKRLTETLKEK